MSREQGRFAEGEDNIPWTMLLIYMAISRLLVYKFAQDGESRKREHGDAVCRGHFLPAQICTRFNHKKFHNRAEIFKTEDHIDDEFLRFPAWLTKKYVTQREGAQYKKCHSEWFS